MPRGVRVALTVAAALCAALPAGVRADEPPAVLPVRLTTAEAVPLASRHALKREVEAIWRRAGVEIAWQDARTPSGQTFRVLITSAGQPGPADGHTWPVAELLPPSGGAAIAVASMAAARRVVDAAGLRAEPDALAARRLGVVLGRAVAHEIGHYLLATGAHRPRGLMRTRIDAGEFADLRAGGFWLDRDAQRMLASASPLDAVARPLLLSSRR